MIARTQEMFSSMIFSSQINIHIFHSKMKLKFTNEGDCGIRTNYQHMQEFRIECLNHKEYNSKNQTQGNFSLVREGERACQSSGDMHFV